MKNARTAVPVQDGRCVIGCRDAWVGVCEGVVRLVLCWYAECARVDVVVLLDANIIFLMCCRNSSSSVL